MALGNNKSLFVATISVLAIANCGKKSSSDDTSTASTTTDTSSPSSVTSSNALTAAYPTSLAISAFPTTTSSSLVGNESLSLADDSSASKNEKAAKILKGDASSCVPDALSGDVAPATDEENCYEFDQDMIYGSMDGGTSFKGTKDGKNSKGEACLVAFARTKIKRVVSSVDRSLGMIQMMMCQAKKAGKDTALANVNDSVDLATALGAADDKMKPSTAKITRLADVVDGEKSYKSFKSEVVVTRKDGVTMSITLYHVQKDTDNKTYYGVLQSSEQMSTKEMSAEGQSAGAEKQRIMTISYGRDVATDGTPTIAYELRNGIFAKALVASAFGDDKLLNLNAGIAADGSYTGYANANDAVAGISYIAFNGNPNTNVGTFSYWQNPGSNYNENARGMVASLVDAGNGLLKGCALSGAVGSDANSGYSIRQALKLGKTLEPKGFYHPFFSSSTGNGSDSVGTYYTKAQGNLSAKWYLPESSTNGSKFVSSQMSNLISKQCYTQDATSKAYLIDTSVTTSAKGYEFVETESSKSVMDPPKPIFKKL